MKQYSINATLAHKENIYFMTIDGNVTVHLFFVLNVHTFYDDLII